MNNVNPSEQVILRHPTEKLEVVLPRGHLAQYLMTLGFSEVEPEPPDLTATLSTDLERTDNEELT